jgi:hypothetical protein
LDVVQQLGCLEDGFMRIVAGKMNTKNGRTAKKASGISILIYTAFPIIVKFSR